MIIVILHCAISMQACVKCTSEGSLQSFVTVLRDDMSNHLWVLWPAGTVAALLGPPLASGEILIHRSHGCSSNPPADAPSLLPRQPATSLLWHACMSVSLCLYDHSSTHLSVKHQLWKHRLVLKGTASELFVSLQDEPHRVREIISKIREKKGSWKAICSNELFIDWSVPVPTLADEWLMATCCRTEPVPRLQEHSNSAFRSMTGRCNLKLRFDLKEVTWKRDSSFCGVQLIALYQLHKFMAFVLFQWKLVHDLWSNERNTHSIMVEVLTESGFRGCTRVTVCSTCSNNSHYWLQQ